MAKAQKRMDRIYIDSDDGETRRPGPDTQKIEYRPFYAEGTPDEEKTVSTLVMVLGDLPAEMQRAALAAGVNQTVGDVKGDADATLAEKFEVMVGRWAQLLKGEWAVEREGGGPSIGVFAEAVAEYLTERKGKECPVETAREFLQGEHGPVLRKTKKVLAIVRRIQLERAEAAAEEAEEADLDELEF